MNESTIELLAQLNRQLEGLRRSIPSHAELLVDECQVTIDEIEQEIRALDLD